MATDFGLLANCINTRGSRGFFDLPAVILIEVTAHVTAPPHLSGRSSARGVHAPPPHAVIGQSIRIHRRSCTAAITTRSEPFPSLQLKDQVLQKHLDIFDINQAYGLDMFEGDIKIDKDKGRNAIIDDIYRWPLTVPYYLEDSLEINAKAVILLALERYRLKTCIEFKPWAGEKNYISFFRDDGCYSYVGNQQRGKQMLSIGTNCDSIAIVQHELLHALGFWHEQSRSDRDDYVTIEWEQILSANTHNFDKYDDSVSSFLNVPYDYTSVMHYSKNAFQNGNKPTILTKNPEFSNLIGQRLDFSDNDIQKLNKLYNCGSSLGFLDSCTFELEGICGILQWSHDDTDWQLVNSVLSGPGSDHTYLQDSNVIGYFMHFSTATGNTGRKAVFESRLFYPKQGSQCLEFFYYNNGHESDRLEIWIQEYTAAFPTGFLRFISTVTGPPSDHWQLHQSSLHATNKFRFVFNGIKGNGISNGGFSVDDINLSENECPQYVWHIPNFSHNLTEIGILSPPYYSKDGYAFQIELWEYTAVGSPFNLAIYLHLISGANDKYLQWPCPWRQATLEFMDQNPDIRQRTSNVISITTDPRKVVNGYFLWDDPAKVGMDYKFPNGTSYKLGPVEGKFLFTVKDWLYRRDFLKGGDVFVLISMNDITYLTQSQAKPNPTSSPIVPTLCNVNICKNDGVCILENQKSVCRCKTFGEYWYVGEKCEKRVPSKSNGLRMSPVVAFIVTLLTLMFAYAA
ncbi:meprin A subunit beta-like [Pelodytes ibericus]